MSTTNWQRLIGLIMATTLGMVLLVGCESPPRREAPPPAPPVESDQGPTQPAPPVIQAPVPPAVPEAGSGDSAPPEAAPPGSDQAPPPPPPPDYIRVLERFKADEPARVEVNVASRRRLVIETWNVSRLRIDRARLPMEINRSIILRLDGQGIEWTAGSTTREFERSVNGEWMPARLREP